MRDMTNEVDRSDIMKKLQSIQMELKAPKGQYNSFGKYYYRNCEDILEAVKPLCQKYSAVLMISDEIVVIGDRYYVKATATITNLEDDGDFIGASAYAREADSKSGMDVSQITGSASSYARKYALNGLFCIDDVKDADDPSQHSKASHDTKCEKQQREMEKEETEKQKLLYEILNVAKTKNYVEKMPKLIKMNYGKESAKELTVGQLNSLLDYLNTEVKE